MGVKPAISLGFRAHWPTTYTATYTGLPDASDAMDEDTLRPRMPAPLGGVESHAGMLKIPPDGQLLYKMITVDNLLRSIVGGYLHFNRVDSYVDFPGADPYDGEQLPQDLQGNASSRFEKAPDFSAADYYDKSRSRTYACCFSLENSALIWSNYANGCEKGKVCLVFDFSKLRAFHAFQRIRWQRLKVRKTGCSVENVEALFRLAAKALELLDALAFGKFLRPLVAITLDHCRTT